MQRETACAWMGVLGAVGLVACASSTGESSTDGQWWESSGSSSGGWSASGSSSSGGSAPSGTSQGRPPTTQSPRDAGPPVECRHTAQDGTYTVYQSADDSNSMASPVIARALIQANQQVPPWMLRTYEFLNYYRIQGTPPEPGELALRPQVHRRADGAVVLQVAVQSAPAPSRRAKTLTFVLDTSGSMADPAPNGNTSMTLLQAAVRAVAHNLAAGDIVNVVTWNQDQRVAVENRVVSGPDDPVLLTAVETMEPDGSTDLSGGLQRGYALASTHYERLRLNRVILISDGMANTGVTDEELIASHAHTADQEGIYLVGIGVGTGLNDQLMDVVTDRGRGAYVYLDSVPEAEAVLGNRFDEVMEVAARGVRLEMTLPWYLETRQFTGEQISTNPREVDPQHLAPDDTMIFQQVLEPCAPSAEDLQSLLHFRVTWTTPLELQEREISVEATLAELQGHATVQLAKGVAVVAYVNALRAGHTDRSGALTLIDQALEATRAALAYGPDAELTEIQALLTQYRRSF